MTPSQLRNHIWKDGEPKKRFRFPDPPPEWPEWRRERLRIAIRAAYQFLVLRKKWKPISLSLRREFPDQLESNNSRQRVQQYIKKGCQFLIDRGVFPS